MHQYIYMFDQQPFPPPHPNVDYVDIGQIKFRKRASQLNYQLCLQKYALLKWFENK